MSTQAIYSALLTPSGQFGITIQATRDGTLIEGLSLDGLFLKEGQTIKLDVTPELDGAVLITLKLEPFLRGEYVLIAGYDDYGDSAVKT